MSDKVRFVRAPFIPARAPVGAIVLVILSSLACTRHVPYPPSYREYAYVTNGGSNNVSVLDTQQFTPAATIAVGSDPVAVVANPRRNEVYVANAGSNSVSVIDAEKNRVVATVPVGRSPHSLDVSPDGAQVYVANSGSNSVSVLDLHKRRVLATIALENSPEMLRVSPDGQLIVVSEKQADSVAVIDAQKLAVRSAVRICPQPTDVVIAKDSTKAFLTCTASGQVAAIGLAGDSDRGAAAVRRNRQVPKRNISAEQGRGFGPDRVLAFLDVGKAPTQLALKPDGGEIFVTNFGSDTISEILPGTNEVGGSYAIGAGPVHALVSADNSVLYVSNANSDTVAVYSIDDGKLVGSVHVGSRPGPMALSSNQNFLFVIDSAGADVSVIRTAAKQGAVLLTILPVGQQPNAIATKAFLLPGSAAANSR